MSGEQVKPGYKRTEVGVIPEDWYVDTVESVTPRGGRNGIVDGPFGSNLKTIHYRKSGIPIITSGYVTEGRFFAESYLYVDKEKFDQEKRSAVKAGDIVMAKIGARCGASAILPEYHEVGILSGNALKITVDQSRHSTSYVWQVLWRLYTTGGIDELRTVGAQPAVSMANLKKYKIPLPPLNEQRSIAAALSEVDALLAQLDQLIAKKRDLKQAAMQQLLTGQTRLPGFSGEWEVKRLGEVACLHRINVVPAHQPTDHFTHFSLPAFDEGRSAVLEPGSAIGSNKFRVPPDAILVSKLNPRIPRIWAPEVIPSNACASTEWLVLTPREAVDRRFLFVVCASPQFCEEMELGATGTTGSHQRISPAAVLRLNVTIPVNQEEQTAIATVVSDMDAELAALEARRDKTRALKQGMMQELLTGRIRLV